ncbi:carotenoid oxygenase family protein [Lusitaniella coriacea LEGE 07157]|uniref:Carotenoid oxygenase family protein n=1 Tax=Lusitaniella coriacea LEGE 07157 TaxID=945747 RepID=A0A8J7DT39_9CYAN|nr:carotenoid oxygenase family protein [Lusitaniella coriacea]MBE9115282.1 carotenoid oxygenase family protein [Lusitaniella coriacea LEGE 07157]
MPTQKAWSKSLLKPAREFPLTLLSIIEGKIPQGLRGTLYRNGSGRLQRGNCRVGHWFDGDGAILAVHFAEEEAKATYRYVQTAGYRQEEAANRFLFPNYGMTAPGLFWQKWLKEVKNVANTSVLAVSDRLLALWEGGSPHALDRETLETLGIDDLSGLKKGMTFSAHPKVDPQTGEIFNFGVKAGAKGTLLLYKLDRAGKIQQQGSAQIPGFPFIHDFLLAGSYLVFFIPPVRVNVFPVALGLQSYSDALQWKPELGTQILIFDRATLSLISRSEGDPWFQFHHSNAFVDRDGCIIAEMVAYEDFRINQYLEEIARGQTQTIAKGTLWQVRLDPQTGRILAREQLLDRGCEFPQVAPQSVGQPWRYTYLSTHREGVKGGEEIFGAIGCFDRKTGELTLADTGENHYPSEPIYAPDALNPQQGWLLTVVYNGDRDSGEVWIYDRDRLQEEPVCKLQLPHPIPIGFHGTWKGL